MEELALSTIRSLSHTISIIATVVIPFEFLLLAFKKKSLLPGDAHVNIICGACILLIFTVVDEGLPYQALQFIETHTVFTLPITLWTTFIYILVGDLCFYSWHRLAHTPLLFKLDHSLHHSSHEFNYTTNLRVSIFVWFYSWIPMVIPIFLGFDPLMLMACFGLANAFPFFLHNEHTRKLGCLEFVFNTPSHHRVHHGKNACYRNKNFGGMFILWDRIFATYAEELEPVKFGVQGFDATRNPARAISQGWRLLYEDYLHSLILRLKSTIKQEILKKRNDD